MFNEISICYRPTPRHKNSADNNFASFDESEQHSGIDSLPVQ